MNLIDRESLLEKIQFRIEPFGVVGATIKDCVEKTREIILAEPVVTENNVGCKWIPVTERLPELYKPVLVCDVRDNFVGSCTLYGDLWVYADHTYELGEMTHWMPLPEPPEEAE